MYPEARLNLFNIAAKSQLDEIEDTLSDSLIALEAIINALEFQPLENQRLSTTDSPTFSGLSATGVFSSDNGAISTNGAGLFTAAEIEVGVGNYLSTLFDGGGGIVSLAMRADDIFTGTDYAPAYVLFDGTGGFVLESANSGSAQSASYAEQAAYDTYYNNLSDLFTGAGGWVSTATSSYALYDGYSSLNGDGILGFTCNGALSMWSQFPPSSQPAAIGDVAGGAIIDAEARAALNSALQVMRDYGLIAT